MRAFFIICIDGEGAVLVAGVREDDQQSGAERGDAAAQPCTRSGLFVLRALVLLLAALTDAETDACGGYCCRNESHVPGAGVVAPHFVGMHRCRIAGQFDRLRFLACVLARQQPLKPDLISGRPELRHTRSRGARLGSEDVEDTGLA